MDLKFDKAAARIRRGIGGAPRLTLSVHEDLHAWLLMIGRHRTDQFPAARCYRCRDVWPCADRLTAEAAIDRLDTVWGAQ